MQAILQRNGREEQYSIVLGIHDPRHRWQAAGRGLTQTRFDRRTSDVTFVADKLAFRAFVSALESVEGVRVPMIYSGPKPCNPDDSPLPEPDDDGEYEDEEEPSDKDRQINEEYERADRINDERADRELIEGGRA